MKSAGTLRQALIEEKKYSMFSNSESEQEALKKKNLRRKHPCGTKNVTDANQMFDKITKDSESSGNSSESKYTSYLNEPHLLYQ